MPLSTKQSPPFGYALPALKSGKGVVLASCLTAVLALRDTQPSWLLDPPERPVAQVLAFVRPWFNPTATLPLCFPPLRASQQLVLPCTPPLRQGLRSMSETRVELK